MRLTAAAGRLPFCGLLIKRRLPGQKHYKVARLFWVMHRSLSCATQNEEGIRLTVQQRRVFPATRGTECGASVTVLK
jgi:hypothetical protein